MRLALVNRGPYNPRSIHKEHHYETLKQYLSAGWELFTSVTWHVRV